MAPRPTAASESQRKEGQPIYVSRLGLLDFRNYERLDLAFGPGMILVEGSNAQGKSNLLEALYVLAIAKSYRASSERELIRRGLTGGPLQAQVAAEAQRTGGRVRVQIDLTASASDAPRADTEPAAASRESVLVEKQVRVNGLRRRASDLVGEINAVLFGAQDLELVLGTPSVRRRYLDILISQLDRGYLKALQRYQRVVSQRNHLLKAIREGRGQGTELDFWDDELVASGTYLVHRRSATIAALSRLSAPIHTQLASGSETLDVAYDPSGEIAAGESEDDARLALTRLLEQRRSRDIGQGFTTAGPHRDDLRLTLDGMEAGPYASRGQCRTVALAMKLAEAAYLREERGEEPVLLLDDVLSELDEERRIQVLEAACRYEQCFITTSDPGQIDGSFLKRMTRYVVRQGGVEPMGTADVAGDG